MPELWFSIFNIHDDYHGTEPPFIEPGQFTWANDIKRNSEAIKKELWNYLRENELESYFNTSMVSKPNSWKTISLKWWDLIVTKHRKKLPFTTALIEKYPNIVSCSFNLLQPNSKILAHKGDTNAIYRCHLGLSIPAGLPECGFKVKEEIQPWKENEWLIFMDAYTHEAWNNTDKNRFILVVDVVRDEYLEKKKKVCATVLTSLFLQKVGQKNKMLYKLSQSRVNFLTRLISPFANLAVWFANAIRLY